MRGKTMNRSDKFYDVTIIGGGLHGAAIAADCAGRGLRTLLCDHGDVGGSHNVVSYRLFHCGLQYLQRGDFSRLADSLRERALLMQRAPHLYQPSKVIIPQQSGFATRLRLNTKAFLYKLIAGQEGKLQAVELTDTELSEPLSGQTKPNAARPAIIFEDAIINDARLAIENLLLAEQQGAIILPQTSLVTARRELGNWQLKLQDDHEDVSTWIQSRCVVNATGPTANEVQKNILGISSRSGANKYRAGYLVVPKLYQGTQSYLLKSNQHHLIAAIPYLDNYTLVGPIVFSQNGNDISRELPNEHRDNLISIINHNFKKQLQPGDIKQAFTVRTSSYKETPEAAPTPLSQDYALDFNCSDGKSPVVTLFGSCVNMHRAIAEQVIEQLAPYIDNSESLHRQWTRACEFPGAQFSGLNPESYLLKLSARYPWMPTALLTRYFSLYGSRTIELLGEAKSLQDLGEEIVPGLHHREIDWLYHREWAVRPSAVIWHRTKIRLDLSEAQISHFKQWFSREYPYQPALSALHLHTQLNKEAS